MAVGLIIRGHGMPIERGWETDIGQDGKKGWAVATAETNPERSAASPPSTRRECRLPATAAPQVRHAEDAHVGTSGGRRVSARVGDRG